MNPNPGIKPSGSGFSASAPRYKGAKKRAEYTFRTRQQAIAWKSHAMQAIAQGKPLPNPNLYRGQSLGVATQHMTISQVIAIWLSFHQESRKKPLKPKTIDGYHKTIDLYIMRFFDRQQAACAVTPQDVLNFRNHLADDGYSASTTKTALWILGAAYRYGISEGHVTHDPTAGIQAREPEVPRRRRGKCEHAISVKEVLELSAFLPATWCIAIWLQRLAGLRAGEAWGMRWKNVHLDDRVMLVQEQRDSREEGWVDGLHRGDREAGTKTPAGTRWVPIPRLLAAVISAYVEDTWETKLGRPPSPAEYLCIPGNISPGGGRTTNTYGAYWDHWARASQCVGLVDKSEMHFPIHELRKAYSTDLRSYGVEPAMISRILGHSLARTSDGSAPITLGVYTKPPEWSTLVAAADALDEAIEQQMEAGLTLYPPPVPERTAVVSYQEAAGLMGLVSAEAVAKLVAAGWLDSRNRPASGRGEPKGFVTQESLEREVARRRNAIGISKIAAEFGIPAIKTTELVKRFGVSTSRGNVGHTRVWISPSGYADILQRLGVNRQFFETYQTTWQASRDLAMTPTAVDILLRNGTLVRCPEAVPSFPETWNLEWVTCESVLKYMGVDETADDDHCMSVHETSRELGVSARTIRDLIRQGRLSAHGSDGMRRIPRRDVEAFTWD